MTLRKNQLGFLMNPFRMAIPPPAGDPYFVNVSLLLHGDGAVGGAVFTDSSALNLTMTKEGAPTTVNTQYMFGTSSILIPQGAKLKVANAAVGCPGDFTVECFVRFSTLVGNQIFIFHGLTNNAVDTWQFICQTNVIRVQGAGANWFISSSAVAINTWYHVALTKNAGTFTLWLNGVSQGTSTQSTAPSGGLSIGGRYNIAGDTAGINSGWVDEVRLTKGVARYTSNFPIPALPFAGADGVVAPSTFDPASVTGTLSGSNYTVTAPASVQGGSRSLLFHNSGKYYAEFTASGGAMEYFLGIGTVATINYAAGSVFGFGGTYLLVNHAGATVTESAILTSMTASGTYGVGLDFATMTITLYRNGVAGQTRVVSAGNYYLFARAFSSTSITLKVSPAYLPSGYSVW